MTIATQLSRASSWALSLLFVALLWQLTWLATDGVGFSSLPSTLASLAALASHGKFWLALADTLFLSMFGLAIGLLVALILGLVLGANYRVESATRGTLNFLRSLPSVILLPLFMSSIGSFEAMVVYLVATVVSFKLVVFVIRGVRDTDSGLRDSARLLRLTRAEKAGLVLLPSAAIQVATGLRLSASRAYGTVVLAGVIAGTPGIGSQIALSRLSPDAAPSLAYALVAGTLGVAVFYGFSALERGLVRWRPTQ